MPSKDLHKREKCARENLQRRGTTWIVTHFLYHPPTLLDGGGMVKALPVGYGCASKYASACKPWFTQEKTTQQVNKL